MIKPSPLQVRSAVGALVLAASTLVGIGVHEGYIETAKRPVPGDVCTEGFGSTTGVKCGDKTTPVRAMVRLLDELENVYAAGVRKCVTVPLYQHEFGAYTSLAYNIGVSAFCGSTLVKKLNSGDYDGACQEIDRWNKSGGRVYPGLVKRRAEERKICEGRG